MGHHEYISVGPFNVATQLSGPEIVHVPTDSLPTPCFDELVTQVTFWARPYDPNVNIYVVPQISIDNVNWESLTAYQFGPLSTPRSQIIKQPIVGVWQRFNCQCMYMLPGSAVAGLNMFISSLGHGNDPPRKDIASVPFWKMAEYLDTIRRGFPAVPPPGVGRVIPFMMNQALMTSDNGSNTNRLIYSPAFPTMEFKKLFLHLHVESLIGRALTTSLKVYFETTIDGTFPEPTESFPTITSLAPLPHDAILEVSTVGAMSRICCVFNEPTPNATQMGAYVSVLGAGEY